MKAVAADVPQVSVLEDHCSFLSLLMIYMPACLRFYRHHNMFADDCQIYLSFSPNEVAQVVEGFNTDLHSVELFGLREIG
jgi:hypothetical protein